MQEKRAWRSITQSTAAQFIIQQSNILKWRNNKMEMHPHHHQPNYRPHAINECSLIPRLTSTMEGATAVIVGGNEVDECEMEASSSDKAEQR